MTRPTQEQREAARELYAALPPDHAVDGDPIGLIAQLLATREAPLRRKIDQQGQALDSIAETCRLRLSVSEGDIMDAVDALQERLEKAERDYRIVEAAIRSFGFPVVEAEPAAAAIRKLGEERDEARAQVEVLREELARAYENQGFLLEKEGA